MSKRNRITPPARGNVQASDTVKTAVDEKVERPVEGADVAGGTSGADVSGAGGTDGGGNDDSSGNGKAEAERLRAEAEKEREETARGAAEEELRRTESEAAAQREEQARAAAKQVGKRETVEVRVLRTGHFGTINDVVPIPKSVLEAAEADGAVCSHPSSVAEAKAQAKDA